MFNMKKILPFLLSAVYAAPVAAQLSEYRTQVQVSNGSGVGTQFAFDGGLNATSASQMLTNSSGSAFAEAASALNAGGFVPTLQARAVADPTRAQAVAWAVQGYTNTSADPVDTSLILSLTADVTGSNDLEARMYLFEDENFEFSIDPGTILFESSSQLWPGFEAFANNPGPTGFDVLRKNVTGPVNETRTFDFTVPPGESFYVWARLVTTADNPGEVDAFSTLTASLSNTAGLQPAAAAASTAPEVECTVATDLLWPPNHKLADVGLEVIAVDDEDPDPTIDVIVFSNEDDDELTASGRHSPDATIDPETLQLRAERRGDGIGRVYLIVVVATDASGNAGFDCCTVVVPHDSSAEAGAEVVEFAEAAEEYCLTFSEPPPGFVLVGDGAESGPQP